LARRTTTRDRLVRTAAGLFWSQGYAQTGVSSIMERASATSGSFYHFFPTKEDLLLAVLDAVGEMVAEEVLDSAERTADTAAGRLRVLADAYRDHVEAGASAFGLPLVSLAGELGADHREARLRLGQLLDELVSRVERWCGKPEADLPSIADQRRFADHVVAALEGAAAMARARGDAGIVSAVAVELVGALDPAAGARVDRGDEQLATRPQGAAALDWRAW